MAAAEGRMRFKVYLDEGQRVAEIFVSPSTQCSDIVHRLQRQIHATDCFLVEVWQGCERLVADNESILNTLLEWGSDLEDVKFYLRRREETQSLTQVVNGSSRVNGIKEESPLSRDVLLGGGRVSVNELKEFAARQQQEIAAKERELKAKQVQLMEMKRKSKHKPQNRYIQQLSAKVDEQGERLTALRRVQDQVDAYKLSNSALAEELDSIRSLFMEKEKELAIAVAKVESLTQQLDQQRKGLSQFSPSREKPHQELELERLRKELMTRNELNHQQSVQIQSQKQLLAEKHKELFELDAQIDHYTEELHKKKSQNNRIDHVNGSSLPSPTGKQDFVEMDYTNFGNFTKKTNKTNSSDSGSFRARSRNSRKLETLLEVEEEVSDGHASNKSSTEDLTQGPGPPRVSIVTALKSRFESEGAKDHGKHWNAHDKMTNGKKKLTEKLGATEKFSNGFSNPPQRVEPEGVETPESLVTEMSVHKEKGRKARPSDQSAETTRKLVPTLQEGSFEFPHSLEVKQQIMGEFGVKTETPSLDSGRTTPSDSGDGSGLSSPSSLSSCSSLSSNSTTPKTAVFAVTGMVKKPDGSQCSTESPLCENTMADDSVLPQRDFQGLSKTMNLQPLRAAKEDPLDGRTGYQDEILKARRVKSEAFPTKNEKVCSVARPSALDFSRAGTKPKRFGVINNSNDRNKSPSLREDKPKQFGTTDDSSERKKASSLTEEKLKQFSTTGSSSDRNKSPSLSEQKANQFSATDDSDSRRKEKPVKPSISTGKGQLSQLQYPNILADRMPIQHIGLTLSKRGVEDQSPNTTTLSEASKKTFESSLGDYGEKMELTEDNGEKTVSNDSVSKLPQSSTSTNNHIENGEATSLPGSVHLNNDDNQTLADSGIDETDNVIKLSDKQIAGRTSSDRPQIPPLHFKPISLRAKKLANEQRSDHTLPNRSHLAPLISNSVSVRGQSSLAKITVTPSATFLSSAMTDIPEKRSPVPTSKRPRFVNRVADFTYPEVKDLLTSSDSEMENTQDGNHNQNDENFVEKESLGKEASSQKDSEQSDKMYRGSIGMNANQQQWRKEKELGKTRETLRRDAKQVVSSFNIQLSSQKRKPTQKEKEIPCPEKEYASNYAVGKTSESLTEVSKITDRKETELLTAEGGRLNSEYDPLNTKTGKPKNENGTAKNSTLNPDRVQTFQSENTKNIRGGSFFENQHQLGKTAFNKSVPTSSLIKLSPSKHVSTPLSNSVRGSKFVVRESIPLMNANKSKVLVNDKSLQSGPSSTMSASSVNTDDKNLEGAQLNKSSKSLVTDERKPSPVEEKSGLQNLILHRLNDREDRTEGQTLESNQSEREREETKVFITRSHMQAKPGAVNGNIKLNGHSIDAVSEQLSSAINNVSLTSTDDNNAKPPVNGGTDIGLVGYSHQAISDQSDNSSVSTVELGEMSSTEVFSNQINALRESGGMANAPARKTDRKKKGQRVSLDPHAVLLDAAVEGELEIVKQIVGEVEDIDKPNSEGITALHNAVCASHDEVVKFLVQYGCNINAQDSHGWTPLHCAAANNATDLARFLVEHGACILAVTTLEKKTPLQCCERGQPGYFNCTKYLNDVQQNFGLDNDGRIYALYSYTASEQDELSFECGEELKVLTRGDANEKEWWWAENKNGETAYIPRNLLGSHARVSPEV